MKRVFAFGDSVMKGVIYDGQNYHVTNDCFASLWCKGNELQLTNYAKMGHTINDGMEIYSKRKHLIGPGDTILLEYGGNDCDFDWAAISKQPQIYHYPKTLIDKFTETYISLVKDIQSFGVQPLLFTLPPLDSKRYFSHFSMGMTDECCNNLLNYMHDSVDFLTNWHEQYNLAIFKIGNITGATVIDISSCILSSVNYCDYICLDGIHPNERGHRLIANTIMGYNL